MRSSPCWTNDIPSKLRLLIETSGSASKLDIFFALKVAGGHVTGGDGEDGKDSVGEFKSSERSSSKQRDGVFGMLLAQVLAWAIKFVVVGNEGG